MLNDDFAAISFRSRAADALAGLDVKEEALMHDREQSRTGSAAGAHIQKDGDKWTLILVRELRH